MEAAKSLGQDLVQDATNSVHVEGPFDQPKAFKRPDLPHSIMTRSYQERCGLKLEKLSAAHSILADNIYATRIGTLTLEHREKREKYSTIITTFVVVESSPHDLIYGRDECERIRKPAGKGVFPVLSDRQEKKVKKKDDKQKRPAEQRASQEVADDTDRKNAQDDENRRKWEELQVKKRRELEGGMGDDQKEA